MTHDEISNADLVRTLVEVLKNACLVGTIDPQHWRLLAEAGRRIEQLEVCINNLQKITQKDEEEKPANQPQPIASAPSGQRILLYCQRPIESDGWWQIGLLCTDIGKFIDDDSEPNWLLVQPSYWLPLPQPPQPK